MGLLKRVQLAEAEVRAASRAWDAFASACPPALAALKGSPEWARLRDAYDARARVLGEVCDG